MAGAVRPTHAEVMAGLRVIFPKANVFDVTLSADHTSVMLCGECVTLKFADMPRIAEVMGTERLNFQAQAGADVVDSYTFDGCVVYIFAEYVA